MFRQILFAASLMLLSAACVSAEEVCAPVEEDGEDSGARDPMRLDRWQAPNLIPFFPDRLDGEPRWHQYERHPQTEPLGEMRNWHDIQTPSWFDNETLDLPFKEDNSDLPVITPKIHINW